MSTRPPSTTLFIGNLPYDVTEQQLSDVFATAGPVKSVRLVNDRESGRFKGFGFCEYYDVATAESAYRNLNGSDVGGRGLRLDYAEDFQTRGAGGGGLGGAGAPRGGPAGAPGGVGGVPIGHGAASAASAAFASLLGAPPSLDRDVQAQLDAAFASMSRAQLYEVMRELKALVCHDRAGARQYFAERPGLAKAVFQGQLLLGMVRAPPPPPSAAPALGGPPPMAAAGAPQPHHHHHPQHHLGPGYAPPPTQPPAPPEGGQLGLGGGSGARALGAGGGGAGPGGILQVGPMQPVPVDAGANGPPPPQAAAAPSPAAAGGMLGGMLGGGEQTAALLRQVLGMSDAQIAALPDEYRQQVLFVKDQVSRGAVKLE